MVLGQEDVKSVPFSSGTASTDDVSTVGDGHKHSLSGSKDTDESSAPRLSALEIRARWFMRRRGDVDVGRTREGRCREEHFQQAGGP